MGLGLYLHVPFCASRCNYCGFYAQTGGDMAGYAAALLLQLERSAPDLGPDPLDSVFLGGGTPSWLPPAELRGLLEGLAPWLGPGTEFTVECNPEDLSGSLIELLEQGGVNRLSLGVQSLNNGELLRAGRRHDRAGARRALALAAGSPMRLAADLILGLPGQNRESFQHSLGAVLAYDPEHLSLYCLELEPGAPLACLFRESPDLDPGDDLRADLYLWAHEHLARAGYRAYEVSNWCRPGGECRHNLAIWRGGEFLGLGPAAHSRMGGRRWSWCADLGAWQAALLAGERPPSEEDRPDAAALALERLLLGLRTEKGLRLDDPLLRDKAMLLEQFEGAGWARREGGRFRLRPEGWLRLDGILARLAS